MKLIQVENFGGYPRQVWVFAEPCCLGMENMIKEGIIWPSETGAYIECTDYAEYRKTIKFCPFCGKEIEK